jgi:hypothetical protein
VHVSLFTLQSSVHPFDFCDRSISPAVAFWAPESQSSSSMKQFFGSKSRNALALVLGGSLLLHIVAVAIFGTVKFVAAVLREEQTFEAPPIEPPPQKEPEYTVNIQQRNKSSSPPRPKPIVVNNPTEIDIPALNIDVNVDSSSVYGRGGGGFGGGGLREMREMAITGNLFGKQVKASNLGVILDVSFSTHDLITDVIDEIRGSFPDAILVFTPGCAINDKRTEVIPISKYDDLVGKYTPDRAGLKFHAQAFVDRLLDDNSKFKKIWNEAGQYERGYIGFVKLEGGAGALGGVGAAMELLVKEGADTIYWFADFDDRNDSGRVNRIASLLKSKKVTLIMHDFVAPLGPKGGGSNKEANLKLLEGLAKGVEGEFFLKKI